MSIDCQVQTPPSTEPDAKPAFGWVYGIQSGIFIKVGKAVDIRARLNTFRLHNPHQLKVVLKRQVESPFWIEARMHRILAEFSIGREWFRCAPIDVKEAFVVAADDFAAYVGEQAQRRTAARAQVESPSDVWGQDGELHS